MVASFRENGTRLFKFRLSLSKIFGPFKLLSRIEAIYYDSSDPFTPVKVVLNTDYQDNGGEGDEFQISGSELQYLFSVYGEFEVGDKIAIVWEKSGSDENATYTVVDVVGDY